MKVTGLYIYPIKSLGGISVSESDAQTEGFQYDRRWMLVDKQGKFLTQREHADMALFSCALESDHLLINYKEEKKMISLSEQGPEVKRVQVWSSKLKAHEVSTEVSEWFSDHLSMSATLVKMTEVSKRPKRLFTEPYKTEVSFADGYPYLIMGEASLMGLNEKLNLPLKGDRFRANIIVDTNEPHEEDNWKEPFSIGAATLKVIKPCARCVVTTIDQQTGVKGKEPLKTLATYRQWRNKIWFGANTICMQKGLIKVGDQIRLQAQ